ncbi:MAG: transposase [Rhodothermales bacterium]
MEALGTNRNPTSCVTISPIVRRQKASTTLLLKPRQDGTGRKMPCVLLVHALHWPMPGKVKGITSAKVKTDSADARMLAQLLRNDLRRKAHMISDELRPLRDVLRTRLKLVERSGAAQNSIHRLLEKMNVEQVDDAPELMQLPARCHQGADRALAAADQAAGAFAAGAPGT